MVISPGPNLGEKYRAPGFQLDQYEQYGEKPAENKYDHKKRKTNIEQSFYRPVKQVFKGFGPGRNHGNVPKTLHNGGSFGKIEILGHILETDEILIRVNHQFFDF